VLLGCTMTGKNKLIDNIINDESKVAFVEMNFIDDGGNEHVIQRQKDKDGQCIVLDGIEGISVERVEQIVGDSELFLCRFNPYYFNEILKPEKKREYIVKYGPIIDMESLFAAQAPRDFITKYSIHLKPTEAKRFRDMLREKETKLAACYSELQVLMQQNNNAIPAHLAVDDVNETNLKTTVEHYRNAELENARIQAAWVKYNDSIQRQSSIKQQIAEIEAKIAGLTALSKPPSANEDPIYLGIEVELNSLQNVALPQFQDITAIQTCPLCYTALSPEHKEHVKQWQGAEVQRVTLENSAIQARRADLQAKKTSRMSELQTANQAYQDFLFEKGQFETQIATLSIESQTADAPPQALYDVSALPQLIVQLEAIVKSNQAARIHNAEVQQLQNQLNDRNGRIAALNNAAKVIEQEKAEISQIADALNATSGIFRKAIELKTQSIMSEFKNVTIELERLVKSTGDYKEVFEIYWEGREYWTISRSERIRCGLEIGNFLSRKSGRNIPVFIDDAESITYIEPDYIQTDQIFYSKVVENSEFKVQRG
jgi:hypothetical protein